MPIETICQGCARKLRVPDQHAGKKARCPQCGTIYVVPSSPDARSPALDETTAPASAQRPAEHEEPKAERWQLRTPSGQVYGPVPRAELDQWYAEGRIPSEATLLREGDPQWRSATEVYPTLAESRKLDERNNPFRDVVTPSASFRDRQPRYRISHRGGLILAFGILGWVMCPVFGPFAWSMGSSDLRAMRMGQMDPAGESMTQAGMVLGIIQTVLFGLLIFFMCLGSFM